MPDLTVGKEVTRYAPLGPDCISPDGCGPFVSHADYAALRAEVERLKGERDMSARWARAWKAIAKHLSWAPENMCIAREQRDEARAEVERLKKHRRECICLYCGLAIEIDPWNIGLSRDELLRHDAECPQNPVVQQVKELTAELERVKREFEESHEVLFVRHIEGHLHGDQVPICKICGFSIFEIYEAARAQRKEQRHAD